MPPSPKVIAALWLMPCFAACGAELILETKAERAPVMQCIEWSEFVQSMADTGIERFIVLAREYIQQSKWAFVDLAGQFVRVNHLDGSPAAGAMAFAECRGIP
jgi:hypothetical protein